MTNPSHNPSNSTGEFLFPFSMRTLVILVIIGFILLLAMSLQGEGNSFLIETTTPVPLNTTPGIATSPSQPSEVIQSNPEQTTGLILGAALLLFIIIVGTLSVIRHKT